MLPLEGCRIFLCVGTFAAHMFTSQTRDQLFLFLSD